MRKRAVVSYILIIGGCMIFLMNHCMDQSKGQSGVLGPVGSFSEGQKLHSALKGAYLTFYQVMHDFSKSTEETKPKALAQAKEALKVLEQLSPNNKTFFEFIDAINLNSDQVEETKAVVNIVYFKRYPDDLPEMYSLFENNLGSKNLGDQDDSDYLENYRLIYEYEKNNKIQKKIEMLAQYNEHLQNISLDPASQKTISNIQYVYRIIDDLTLWLLGKNDQDYSPKITAVTSELYKNIIQTLTKATFKLSEILLMYQTKGMKDYCAFLKNMMECLNILRERNILYTNSIEKNEVGSEKENIEANIKNIMQMMNYYGAEIKKVGNSLIFEIENSMGIAANQSLDEIVVEVKNILDKSQYLKDTYKEVLKAVKKKSRQARDRIYQQDEKDIPETGLLSESVQKSMLVADYQILQSSLAQRVRNKEDARKHQIEAEKLQEAVEPMTTGMATVSPKLMQQEVFPKKEAVSEVSTPQLLSPQEAAVKTKLAEYQTLLQSPSKDIRKIFDMVDDILSWLLPKDDKDISPKINPNTGTFYKSIIQTLTDATWFLPNFHPDKMMYKNYFEDLSKKIQDLTALTYKNIDSIQNESITTAEKENFDANDKNIMEMMHSYNEKLDDGIRTLIQNIKNGRGIAENKSLDEVVDVVRTYLERPNDTILSENLAKVLGEINNMSEFERDHIINLLRSGSMVPEAVKEDQNKRKMLKADYELVQKWISKNEESYHSLKRGISSAGTSLSTPLEKQSARKDDASETKFHNKNQATASTGQPQTIEEVVESEEELPQPLGPTSGGGGPSRTGIFDVLSDIWDGITSILSSFFNTLWSLNPFRSK